MICNERSQIFLNEKRQQIAEKLSQDCLSLVAVHLSKAKTVKRCFWRGASVPRRPELADRGPPAPVFSERAPSGIAWVVGGVLSAVAFVGIAVRINTKSSQTTGLAVPRPGRVSFHRT